ncbi:MAG: hypothetical protein HKM89_03890 [Gemmatimonadales bacterium]|nr:hypothetical protein [Gemmatimonadales bacterium]
MAFEIFLFRFKESHVELLNATAVSGVLERHGIEMSCEQDYVDLRDGLSLEITTSGIDEGELLEVALSFRGTSDSLHQLVFDLMLATEATALVVEGRSTPLLSNRSQEADLPEADFAPAVVCSSWEDVRTVVEQGFRKWAEWVGIE